MKEVSGSPERTLWVIVIVVTISYIGVALPYPILAPLFLAENNNGFTHYIFNFSPEMSLGLILAAYPIGMFIGNLILGAWADKFGRKPMLVISLCGSAIGYLLSAYALSDRVFVLLLASRLLTGVFEGNVPIARAIAVDLSPAIPKSKSFGHIAGAVYAGYLIGPLLGGGLVVFSYAAPFYLAAGIAATMGVVVFFILNETSKKSAENKHLNEKLSYSPWLLLKSPVNFHLFSINLLLALGVSIYYQFYPVLLVEHWAFSSADIAYITVVLTIALMFSSVVLIKWTAARFSYGANIIVSGSLLALLLIAILMPDREVLIWLAFPLIGLAIPVTSTHLSVYTSNQLSDSVQGRLMGLLGSGGALGSSLVILASAYMAQFSVKLPFVFGAAVISIAMLYFAMFYSLYFPRKAVC